MILMEFLFAPTVPSAPSPQNLQLIVPSGVVTIAGPVGRDLWVRIWMGARVSLTIGIAAAAGYQNVSYFRMSFKGYFGMTPSQYRQIQNNRRDVEEP